MSVLARWILILIAWTLSAGAVLYAVIAFVTGSVAIMEWYAVPRGIFAFVACIAGLALTAVTSDIETERRREVAKTAAAEQREAELEPYKKAAGK